MVLGFRWLRPSWCHDGAAKIRGRDGGARSRCGSGPGDEIKEKLASAADPGRDHQFVGAWRNNVESVRSSP